MFQSTPPRGKRPYRSLTTPSASRGFNPRPRAGSDSTGGCSRCRRHLSFNPRPRAGSDEQFAERYDRVRQPFQSTPPRGKRLSRHGDDMPVFGTVSIHAPAREATWRADRSDKIWTCFNPRPRAGSDTRCVKRKRGTFLSFNPRPRAGSDSEEWTTCCSAAVSIHAPAREATPSCCK